jgi:HK97 family phage major capsid protein
MTGGTNNMDNELKTQLEAIQTASLERLATESAQWKKHFEELKAAGAPVPEIQQKIDRALKRIEHLEQEASRPVGTLGSPFQITKSIGETLVGLDAYKEWVQRIGTSQKSGFQHRVSSLWPTSDYGVKTTITSSAVGSSTPGILVPERIAGVVKPGVRRLRVRDLIPRFPTTNNAIEWVRENAFTNAASPTAETVSKPESALTFVIDSVPVRTIAHWIPAAAQVIADFGQLQAYIETRLIEGLKDIEDNEIVAGDGTGQHLSGFSTEATAYDTARNVAGDTRIDRLNHAISQVEDVLHEADGIILHPRDWRAIQLIKTDNGGANTGEYILGGPVGNADPMLWGLHVATTTAITAGQFFVGAFQRYVAIHDRMDARIDVSTEHADFFIRNLVAIRAEERIALSVLRADALIFGSF